LAKAAPRYASSIAPEVRTTPDTSKEGIAERLADARQMTLRLIEPLSEEQLNRVYSPILSPLIWDLGHIANFEELWLVQTVGGREPLHGDLGRLYDAIENPRKTRGELPILRGEDLRDYLADVRERALEVLDEVDLDSTDDPLLRDGFVYEMLLAHEHQHNETMLQLLQLVEDYAPGDGCPQEPQATPPEAALIVPGKAVINGEHEIGATSSGFAYDNERPRHTVELSPVMIDIAPVTNGEFEIFMRLTGAEPPLYWESDGEGGWLRRVMGRTERVNWFTPVTHVDFQQAQAFAEWRKERLPTEFEWEAAARAGVLKGVGLAWEWTSSEFAAYPGFEAFPYREYSEAHFDQGYRVLRGASWATHPGVARPSFRNWDLPERRQIFAGFRCARDA
jgi:iron(II)-dependent oxidoreductase